VFIFLLEARGMVVNATSQIPHRQGIRPYLGSIQRATCMNQFPIVAVNVRRKVMSWWNSGKSDASQNKGQKNPGDFKSDKERKDYQAGHNQGKQDQNKKK
jgi:hypothetical protein